MITASKEIDLFEKTLIMALPVNINNLINKGYINLTIPDKSTSKAQKYITSEKGLKYIEDNSDKQKDGN